MSKDERRDKNSAQPVEEPEKQPKQPQGMPTAGYFGEFGGQEVPEALQPLLLQLEATYLECLGDERFNRELRTLLADYIGRPSALHYARRLSQWAGGARIYFKREDLLHGNSHRMNGLVGQALLAKKLGRKRLITETAAGDQGVMAAMAAALVGLPLEIFWGQREYQNQSRNIFRMRQLGAKIRVIPGGQVEAVREAMLDWSSQQQQTFYLSGSAVGPHPYPWIVREFERVIGDELKGQMLRKERRLPDALIASVIGGSSGIGLFYPFVTEEFVHLVAVEPGGASQEDESSAGQLRSGSFHGMRTLVLQSAQGEVNARRSIAPELCYPAIGPEHAVLRSKGREERVVVRDQQALEASRRLIQLEGIFCSFESGHAVHAALDWAKRLGSDGLIVVMLSGSYDRELEILQRQSGSQPSEPVVQQTAIQTPQIPQAPQTTQPTEPVQRMEPEQPSPAPQNPTSSTSF